MKRRLTFSDKAEKDLEEIYEYSSRAFGKHQARRYVTKLHTEIEKRAEDPDYLSQKESELASYIRAPAEALRSFLHEKHRCYFTFDDVQLRVLMISHGAQNKVSEFQKLVKLSNG